METGALIRHLEEKERKEGTLPQLLQFYQKLLRVQHQVEQKLASRLAPGLNREAINRRLELGIPLIAFDELALDWPLLIDTFNEVAAIFADYSGLFNAPPDSLRELKADPFLTEQTVKTWFEKNTLPAKISAKGISKNLLTTIIHSSLKPFLVSHAKTLADSIDQERWRRSCCPVCGGSPDLAFLDKERGSRWLVCSRCDTEWLFQRLQCPFCGTQDQNALAYFTDDEGIYRLYVCERCKHYLKAIDLRLAKDEVLLPLERFYTLDLDRQAKEQGYIPYDRVTRDTKQTDKAKRPKQS